MATCQEDELYVEAVRQISAFFGLSTGCFSWLSFVLIRLFWQLTGKVYSKSQEPRIQFLDARPRINAFANQLNGAGTEDMSNYKRSKRKFLGIGNIHVMRNALYKVEKLAFLASDTYVNDLFCLCTVPYHL